MKKLLTLLVCVLFSSLLIACNAPSNNKTTVTLDLNGGSIVGETVLTATQGENLSITEPTKTGYDFIGWTYNDEPVSLTPFTLKEEAITLKANWQAKSINYTFNLLGGSGDFEGGVISYGDSTAHIKSLAPNNENGNFLFWLVNGEELGDVWTYLPETENEPVTIIAQYEATFLLTFVHYDNSKEYVSFKVDEGVSVDDLPYPKTKKGYNAEWEISFDEMITFTQSTTINAVLKPNAYTALFKNGTITETLVYTYDKKITLPTKVRNGYKFSGWSTKADGSSGIIKGEYVWNFDYTVMLYAIYTPNTYTITYDTSNIGVDFELYNGNDKVLQTTQQVTFDKNYTLYTVKTKNNVANVVWLYNGEEIEESGSWSLTGNVTLTAKIIVNEVEIDVNVDVNGGSGEEDCKLVLTKPFKLLTPVITAPNGKWLAGFNYKNNFYSIVEEFNVYDYDGSPLVAVYKDKTDITVNVDVNGGVGESTAVIELGGYVSTISNRPKAPSGKKLIGFYYKEKMYLLTDIWAVEDYDGESLIAHYIGDNEDWSPLS